MCNLSIKTVKNSWQIISIKVHFKMSTSLKVILKRSQCKFAFEAHADDSPLKCHIE